MINRIILIFLYYIPTGAVVAAGLYVTLNFLRSPMSFEHGNLFFGLDIATATLAGLSFYASYTSTDKLRKTNYYTSAENFFRATVQFMFVAFLQQVVIQLKGHFLPGLFLKIIVLILSISIIFCFGFGFKHFVKGIIRLMKTFRKIFDEQVS